MLKKIIIIQAINFVTTCIQTEDWQSLEGLVSDECIQGEMPFVYFLGTESGWYSVIKMFTKIYVRS